MTGEMAGYAMERLFDEGALDVYYTPIYMKKNRPAIQIGVICKQKDMENLKETILRHTTTIGVRTYSVERTCMERSFITTQVRGEEIPIKVVQYKDIKKFRPEYESCKKAAQKLEMTLEEIYEEAIYKAKRG